jgi:hypothetical protein
MQPGEPATRARVRFDNAAVVAGSVEGLTMSAGADATAACLVTGGAASSAAAFAAAGLATFSSGLPGSAAVGALLASTAAGALLTSALAGALLASPVVSSLSASTASGALLASVVAGFVSAAVEARSLALCRSMKSLQVIGKTISPETVTPIGVHPPGGGPSSENRGWGSGDWATPTLLIPNKAGSVAAEMRRIAHKCRIANNSTNLN